METFAQRQFDIVLLDMKLPRMSGVDVLFELRKINPGARVVMMSGHSVTDLMAQAMDGGAHRIFYPPYKLDSLLSTLRALDGSGLVLVVDKDADLARNVESAMTGDGLSVFTTADGGAAQARLENGGCDLLVLERQRHVIQGLEVYWSLKARGLAVPTVIVTPGPDEPYLTIEKLNQYPVCGYFIKPFDPFELLPALESLAAS